MGAVFGQQLLTLHCVPSQLLLLVLQLLLLVLQSPGSPIAAND
jgi:hypothetical protein